MHLVSEAVKELLDSKDRKIAALEARVEPLQPFKAKILELETEVEHLRNERNEWSRRHGIVEARVKELEEDNTTLHNAVVDSKEAQKAAEAKVAAGLALPRYAVNQAIGREGEYPMYADPTGSWIGYGELYAALSDKGGE